MKQKLENEDLQKAIDLYVNQKWSTRKVAEEFNMSKPTIIRILMDADIEIRKPGRQDSGFDQKEYMKTYDEIHKEEKNVYLRNWMRNNRQKLKENQNTYREKNKEKIKVDKRNYEKLKREDPLYRFRKNLQGGIWETLKTKRVTSPFNYLPYTMEDLFEHIEKLFTPGMTWDNYGEWHLDHIKPQSHFIFTNPTDSEFLECWSLSNLQPLWATTREIDGIVYEGNLNKNNWVDGKRIIKTDIILSGNTFHGEIPLFKNNIIIDSMLTEEQKKEIGEKYLAGMGILKLSQEYKVGKIRIKAALKSKGVKLRTKEDLTHKTDDANKLYKENLSLKPEEGKMFILVCKKTGKMFKDYLNKSGAISEHVLKVHNIQAPNTHFKRQYFLENGKHWFTDYFELKQIDYFGK